MAAREIFNRVKDFSLYVTISMFEIYGQKVRDLLNGCKELQALEDGKGVLQLVGLYAVKCRTIEDFCHMTNVGRTQRSTNATGANATSSRSHAAMLIRFYDVDNDYNASNGGFDDSEHPYTHHDINTSLSVGKFTMIDLAGSERGADNGNTDKTTQREGRQINTSLLALKEVIRAKKMNRSHKPFRQSRLTQVLEESLTGRFCYTVVIGCISPAQKDIAQTLNTLRYAESTCASTAHALCVVHARASWYCV